MERRGSAALGTESIGSEMQDNDTIRYVTEGLRGVKRIISFFLEDRTIFRAEA
jgi:hypothetical protein